MPLAFEPETATTLSVMLTDSAGGIGIDAPVGRADRVALDCRSPAGDDADGMRINPGDVVVGNGERVARVGIGVDGVGHASDDVVLDVGVVACEDAPVAVADRVAGDRHTGGVRIVNGHLSVRHMVVGDLEPRPRRQRENAGGSPGLTRIPHRTDGVPIDGARGAVAHLNAVLGDDRRASDPHDDVVAVDVHRQIGAEEGHAVLLEIVDVGTRDFKAAIDAVICLSEDRQPVLGCPTAACSRCS